MLEGFDDGNCTINWAKFNDAKIIYIRSLRIELCFVEVLTSSISWICACKTNLNWSQSSLNWDHTNVQSITAQCAMIEFQLFLHSWISLNSYYNLRHWSFIAYMMIINWAVDAIIAWALHAQNEGARNDVEHVNSSQQVHEIEFVKTSTKHSSMRNDQISIIFASLNFSQFILYLTSLKLYSICDDYQLSSRCNNCMSFDVLEWRVAMPSNFSNQERFNFLRFTLINLKFDSKLTYLIIYT